MHRRSPFELEAHEEAADDPRMPARMRARNAILIATAAIVPLSALLLIVTVLVWDAYPELPLGVWASALLHPFLASALAMAGIYIHRQAYYNAALVVACLPALNVLFYIVSFLFWVAG